MSTVIIKIFKKKFFFSIIFIFFYLNIYLLIFKPFIIYIYIYIYIYFYFYNEGMLDIIKLKIVNYSTDTIVHTSIRTIFVM